MKEILLQIKQYFSQNPELSFLILIVLLVFVEKKLKKLFNISIPQKIENFIIGIADEAVLNSAIYLNSESGQAKLENAVKYMQHRINLAPWYVKFFIPKFSKFELVNLIEKSYQIYKKKTNSKIPDEKLDIKGNEIKKN